MESRPSQPAGRFWSTPVSTELSSAAAQNKSQPLLVGGTTLGSNPTHAVDAYHDLFGTLNPRLLVLRDPDVAVQPLYAPTCNLVLYLGDGTSSRLPRFNERFREASKWSTCTRAQGSRF